MNSIHQLQADIRQVIMSAHNAMRTLDPAIKRCEQIAYLKDKSGSFIGPQFIELMIRLESFSQSMKDAQGTVEDQIEASSVIIPD